MGATRRLAPARTGVLVVLVLSLVAAMLATPVAADEHEATVTGTVTDAETGDPIEGATVAVGEFDQIFDSTTDSDGTYTVDGIEPGVYNVVADARRYALSTERIQLEDGETREVDFALEPREPADHGMGYFEGNDEDLDEEFVGAACFQTSHSILQLRGEGTYHAFDDVGDEVVFDAEVADGEAVHEAGPIELEIDATQTYYHGPEGTHGTDPLQACDTDPGQEIPAEFRLFADGHVHDGDGGPCTGEGHFWREGDRFEAEWHLTDDCVVEGNEAGTPGAGVAPAGTHQILQGVHEGCFDPGETWCQDNIRGDYGQSMLDLTPGEVAGTVTAANTGEAIEGATVTAVDADEEEAASATTDGAGDYELLGLAPGDYEVSVDAEGYLAGSADVEVPAGETVSRDFALDVAPETLLSLTGPDEAEVGEQATLTATLTHAGEPVAGVEVDFSVDGPEQATPESATAQTDEQGETTFAFSADAEGDFTATATAVHDDQQVSASHAVAFAEPAPPELDLSGPSQVERGQDFTMVATLTEDGDPVEGVDVDFSTTTFFGQASPTSGTATTDTDGEAAVTFTAIDGGFVNVTAEASHAGEDLSITRNVTFTDPPAPPELALTGHDEAPTGGETTVTATVTDADEPVAGVTVDFDVDGPDQASPEAASVDTDDDGEAAFAFAADEAGDYTITATATYDDDELSDTHTVAFRAPELALAGDDVHVDDDAAVTATLTHLDDPVDGVDVDFTIDGPGDANPNSATVETDSNGAATLSFEADQAGDYTVIATASHANHDLTATHSVALITFKVDRTLTLNEGEDSPYTVTVDPAGDYAYVALNDRPAEVIKIDLDAFERIDALTLEEDERNAQFAAMDPEGNFLYVSTLAPNSESRLVKIDLATFERVDALAFDPRAPNIVIDPAGEYAYLGTSSTPGQVIKVDLETFAPVDTLTLEEGEDNLAPGAVDPSGDYAYFGTRTTPGHVVKVDLATLERVDAITLADDDERDLVASAVDGAGNYAYFGTSTNPGRLIKVDLTTFERVDAVALQEDAERAIQAVVIDPDDAYAYVASNPAFPHPAPVTQIDLATFERVGALAAADATLRDGALDPRGEHAYFAAWDVPGQLVKVALSPVADPGSIAGQVTDDHSGEAIESAEVTAVDADEEALAVSTDAAGNYEFAEFEPGIYTLTAEADGYQPPAEEHVVVEEGETTRLDFALSPEPGAVAGVVVHANSERPIAGATVTLIDPDGTQIAQTTTESSGHYEMDDLPPGDYTVAANAERFRTASTDATVESGEATAVDFALQAGKGPPPDDRGPPPGRGPR